MLGSIEQSANFPAVPPGPKSSVTIACYRSVPSGGYLITSYAPLSAASLRTQWALRTDVLVLRLSAACSLHVVPPLSVDRYVTSSDSCHHATSGSYQAIEQRPSKHKSTQSAKDITQPQVAQWPVEVCARLSVRLEREK
jgi:hypothetical protein